MSQSHFNYMSGVPVKIAESYKPPKKLALTQSVSQRLSTSSSITTQLLEKSTYDFTLERTMLAKMSEWQHMRQHENCDRKERLRLYQQERQSLFDAKQKQMLTAVSYPSTDDLSSDDDGDDSGHGTSSSDASKSAVPIPAVQSKGPQQQFSPPNYFNNILVPTVMPGQANTQIKQNIISTKTPHYSKINFHEFESDNSSPFDNVELKTINDLDILAEVWNTSVAINNPGSNAKDNTPTSDEPSSKINSTMNTSESNQLPNHTYQPVLNSNSFHPGALNAQQQNQTNSKHMKHSVAAATNSTIPITNSYYVNQVHYNHHIDPNQTYSLGNQTYINTTTINNNPSYAIAQHSFAPNNYIKAVYNGQRPAPANVTAFAAATPAAHTTSVYGDKTVITNSIQAKSKSKSVPDIVQEINAEIQNSQGRRVRNNSQSENKDTAPTSQNTSDSTNSIDANPIYSKLSVSSRNLARNISSMGFPLEQVARITEKLGKDDKKIIEHLIRLGELLDLGFEEQQISDALLKFDNNKEKALDFLIS
ncbi:uncharacterized protein LOC129577279 [Sitodiplosis mosellana]|uniref:uncharacterized protein LOC129577279 n=1 Tax=Sitodiplosis mosellana TaxID=263140 RepID=UPI00244492E7|nr:uncharacterized protein LOC129577279 [Sitodiplosis mosellana]